ncbi:hypothetical protein Nepgr_015691 [Nepenthes gracilis]|uniref:Uncharacterized protein n=1 Tax=Nepenthes gracilis TaxID=150966 RepID=A0AAD3SLE9_NEPGR|nr:hypothetical protein Nepgr_015691 [Nepenthes gracilis]
MMMTLAKRGNLCVGLFGRSLRRRGLPSQPLISPFLFGRFSSTFSALSYLNILLPLLLKLNRKTFCALVRRIAR